MLVEQMKIVSNEYHLTNNILELFLAQTLVLKDVRKKEKEKTSILSFLTHTRTHLHFETSSDR